MGKGVCDPQPIRKFLRNFLLRSRKKLNFLFEQPASKPAQPASKPASTASKPASQRRAIISEAAKAADRNWGVRGGGAPAWKKFKLFVGRLNNPGRPEGPDGPPGDAGPNAVSYTHLTLPTILRV